MPSTKPREPMPAAPAQPPSLAHEVLPSLSQHVQLALVQASGPAHHIAPQPYLRITLNIGASYAIDAVGPQGAQRLTCRRHSMLVFPPDTPVQHRAVVSRSTTRAATQARLATFRISSALMSDCAIGLGLTAAQAKLRHQVVPGDEVLQGLAQALLADLRAGCPDGPQATERTACALVSRVLLRQSPPAPSVPDDPLARVQVHIEENLQLPLALEPLAAMAGMSVFHFCRVFRARFGVTPHQHILARRMALAKRLLWEGAGTRPQQTVLQVALACGFSSPSHFSAQFRRHFGQTPLQWQRSGRQAKR